MAEGLAAWVLEAPDGFGDAGFHTHHAIQLSRKLGMETTAEGVETAEQLAILGAEGCTTAQGFHISRPVPAGAIAALLERLGPVPARRAG